MRDRTAEQQLAVINAVAEAVNQSGDLGRVMDLALGLVTDLLELQTGWVYLLDEQSQEPGLCASRSLPPVFEAEPDRWEGLCYCVQSLLEGDTRGAANVNVVSCSRLWHLEAAQADGLAYHASIPFYSHGRQMGIMNVARADWGQLTAAQLALLTSVGNLLGMAVERDRLVAASAAEAVKAERERVGRELHDSVMQGLTGISLQLEVADAVMDRDKAAARARVRAALKLTQETVAETRGAVDNLAAPALRQQPLWAAIEALCARFAEMYGIAVECDARPLRERPPIGIEQGVYRVVSEGLNNVVKHAGATRVGVSLRQREGRLLVILEDDGRGFARGTASFSAHGYGLHSMRRRVKMMGGRYRLISSPGKGTRVEVSVPLGGTGREQ